MRPVGAPVVGTEFGEHQVDAVLQLLREPKPKKKSHKIPFILHDNHQTTFNVFSVSHIVPKARQRLYFKRLVYSCSTDKAQQRTIFPLRRSAHPSSIDSQGRIVLDESPCCVKHIIHTLLDNCSDLACGKAKAEGGGSDSAVAPEEEANLLYTSHVLKLASVVPTYPERMVVTGGSEIAESLRFPWWTTCIRSWCPDSPAGLRLLYRASLHGFSAKSFRDRAGSASKTVTLIRVSSSDGRPDNVVGGYSSESWTRQLARKVRNYSGDDKTVYHDGLRHSWSAYVFMLDSPNMGCSKPFKWGLKQAACSSAVFTGKNGNRGPCFGSTDLRVNFNEGSCCTLQTGRETYDVPEGSTFLQLSGEKVGDIEVFEVLSNPLAASDQPSTTTPWNKRVLFHQSTMNMRQMKTHYTQNFGASIAGLLVEERMAISYARAELEEAQGRAAAAVRALKIVYGPDVASGKQDEVMELSVRGVSMTTLRSTLEVCPDSVFIAWFADRWSGGSGKDEDGRYEVDCDPTSFSKILDVMRMRKRAGLAERDDVIKDSGAGQTVRVQVLASRFEAFEVAVDMYFPNCAGFIMDLVERF